MSQVMCEKRTECDMRRGLTGGGVSSTDSLAVEEEAREGDGLRGLLVLVLVVSSGPLLESL